MVKLLLESTSELGDRRAVLAEVVVGEAGVGIDFLGGPGERECIVVGATLLQRGGPQRTRRVSRERVAPRIKRPPRKVPTRAREGEHVAERIRGDGLPGRRILEDGADAAGATGALERPRSIRPTDEAPALRTSVCEGGFDAEG